MADMLAVVSGIREKVVMAAKKLVAVAAAATVAEGIWAVVWRWQKWRWHRQTTAATAGQATAAETEAAAGQQQSTKTRQELVAAAAAPASVAAGAAVAVVVATTAEAERTCGCHIHCLIYSRGGAFCSTGNQIGEIQRHFGYFWHLQILFAPQIKLFAAQIIGAANNFICICK